MELDPVLDLDPDERWKAGILGVKRRFSRTLRTGLAQSLALLGAGGPGLRGHGGVTAAQWARQTVRDLLARANADNSYRLWSSLNDVLCLLAEASPDAFLDAMQEGLRGTPPLHAAMFADNANDKLGMGGNSPHTHFLWALETLAWSPEYIDRAVDVLAALTALDPGGRLSNRPMASLVGILSAWSPNTSADTDNRIRAIERLMRQHPAVGRRLLLNLIPHGGGFQTVHPGPRFRDWKKETPVTHGDLARVVNTVVELLIKDLDTSPERHLAMINKIDVISPGHRLQIAERLTTLAGTLEDDDQRAQIFDALHSAITKHREYSDAQWALPDEELRDLQAACDAFAPHRPDLRHAWLFSSDWITLGDKSRREDYAAYEAEVLRRRAYALGEVIADGGLDAIIAFASTTQSPHLVGIALAKHSDSYDLDMLRWLESDIAPQRDVAAAYLGPRLRSGGEELRDGLLARTEDALTQARILRFTGDPDTAWPKLAKLGHKVTEHYWREFIYFGLGPEFPQALEAAWSLLDAGRAAAALDLIMLYGLKQDNVEAAEVTAAGLERLLETGLDEEFQRLGTHTFEQLFALLARHRDEVGRYRVVNLEWQLFPTLGFDAEAPTLHQALVEEPAFFVDLVTMCFRPVASAEEGTDDPAQLEQRRAVATRAYEVLRSLRRCPGMTNDGQLDATALREWATEARAGLESANRLSVGDVQIGEILAFAPPNPDGSLIHEVVQELLEDVRSDELDRGLAIGIRNKRGVTSRGLLDGGSLEWELARNYAEQAKAAQAWPRTRKLLNGLAELYEIDARQEDQEAERRHQGLGW